MLKLHDEKHPDQSVSIRHKPKHGGVHQVPVLGQEGQHEAWNGKVFHVPLGAAKKLSAQWELGYRSTLHAYQGQTCDSTLWFLEGGGAMR